MIRIRFHGRGGQGIKTAAQVLGTTLFREGFEVQDAPRYGAERRGAPIFAYVRAARGPIHERGVITRPDLVVVADDTLVPMPAAAVLQGVSQRTRLLIHSAIDAEEWARRLGPAYRVLVLPVPESGGHEMAGMRCAGAAAALIGSLGRDSLVQAVRTETARYGDAAVERGLKQALASFEAVSGRAGPLAEAAQARAEPLPPPQWVTLGPEAPALSAPDIHGGATSELANTGTWRTLRPVIDLEHCNRCSWICATLCPDSAIRVDAERTPRIDLDHCKGCLVCVAVCPPHAIRAVAEAEVAA
jgi:pyruvate ferredoxin oxidoreductase gamma subunit